MDRAYFLARVERVPQDVINWDGQILDNARRHFVEILSQSWRILGNLGGFRHWRGRGGKAKAKAKV